MPKRNTVGLIAVVAVAVALVGVFAAREQSHSARRAHAPGVSTDPTNWSLPALDGAGTVALAQFRGRPTVVNFFASWCSACDFELPGFATVSRQLSGQVHFVGVAPVTDRRRAGPALIGLIAVAAAPSRTERHQAR